MTAKRTQPAKPAKKSAAKGKAAPVKKSLAPSTPTERLNRIGIEAICDDIRSGMLLTHVAKARGFDRRTLADWINHDDARAAKAREARSAAAQAYDEAAQEGIEDARDPFGLARAREVAHHLRWRASKINPREYGDKVAIGGSDDMPAIKSATTVTLTPSEAYRQMLGKKA